MKETQPPLCCPRLKRYLTNNGYNNICHHTERFVRFFLLLPCPTFLFVDVYNVVSSHQRFRGINGHDKPLWPRSPRISLELIGRHRWLPETLYTGHSIRANFWLKQFTDVEFRIHEGLLVYDGENLCKTGLRLFANIRRQRFPEN